MDPATMNALINGGSKVLGQAMTVPPAGPSSAYQSAPYSWGFDSSGFNVNFGGGNIDSKATKTGSDPLGLSGMASGLSLNWQTVAFVGLGLAAVWALKRR